MKKAIIFLMIICILLSGCISNGNNNTPDEKITFTVWVRNKSNQTINGSINAIFDKEPIISSDFHIDKDNISTFESKCVEGSISIEIKISGYSNYSKEVNINSNQKHHYFDIYNNTIKYVPPPS